MSDPDLRILREGLEKRLVDLRQTIDSTADSRKPVELDQASVGRLSRMDALQMQAMAHASERMRGQEIERIKATIKRIDEGEYGFCVNCDEQIGAKRLAIDPTIPNCIRCASGGDRKERNGSA
ncbi:DnaK suppressor protein [Rhodoligotrophos appendicifer]|uniref:TraR/DksA family transcriptional regulator n=1 Tax=Rhodoligotrophos appendicifer TaxID=987056 RepID=UPI0011847FF7|nr:TraR/DksA C4-type zinc finger protein [Rhodoligotrophos appendicifer]